MGGGRWFLQKAAFSNMPWRCSGDDLGPWGQHQPLERSRTCPANSLISLEGLFFKIFRGLKYFHLVGREEPFTHLRCFLFKSRFCQSVTRLLSWWVYFFCILFYGRLPVLARVCRGARGRGQALPFAFGSALGTGCSLMPPTECAPLVSKTRLATGSVRGLGASGRKWFYRSELLQGWWPAASAWSPSFGACEDLWIALVSAEPRCWLAVQLTSLHM